MRVTDIMTPAPACCTPEAMLPEVARLMVENDCGEIPIVTDMDARQLVGVITDRDVVCRAIAKDKNPARTKVSDIMSGSVVTVSEDADVHECCEKMEEHQVRRIPVLDARGRVSGIVAQADIALEAGSRETAEVVKDVSKPGHAGI